MNGKWDLMMNRTLMLSLILLLGMSRGATAATSATTNVSATILPATCDVTAPGSIALTSSDGTALIGKNQVLAGHMPLNLSLNCTGVFEVGANPKITVMGDANSPVGGTAESKKLFRSSSSSSQGFAIALANKAGTPDAVWGDIIEPGASLAFSQVNGPQSKTLQVALACGSTSDCAQDKLKSGALSASMTFTYAVK